MQRISPSRVARYFFHECERNLRWLCADKPERDDAGVVSPPRAPSAIHDAVLQGGYVWEERVVRDLLGDRARVAPGEGPLRDRHFDETSTLAELARATPGQFIYQPTLEVGADFLREHGLDPSRVEFSASRPDLLECLLLDGRRAFRVIDVKASDDARATHKVQVAVYALMLEHTLRTHAIDAVVDEQRGGVWLHEQRAYTPFDLSATLPPVRTFVRDTLARVLATPIGEAPWHLHFRCEWCEYFKLCKAEASADDSVSLVPYLTVAGRTYLRQLAPSQGGAVQSKTQLRSLLDRPDVDSILEPCGSLQGRADRLRAQLDAMSSNRVVPYGAASVALPKAESIRVILCVQREPLGGAVYVVGVRNEGPTGFFERNGNEVFLARNRDEIATVRRDVVAHLHRLYAKVDQHNRSRVGPDAWKNQHSLQTYVFDGYERTLLIDLLVQALDDPGPTAEQALDLLFFFQDVQLIESETHADKPVPYPIVVLTDALRELAAIPSKITLHLRDAARAFKPKEFASEYKSGDYFAFELSNAMKSDAVFALFNGDASKESSIRIEVEARLKATRSALVGARERLEGQLISWAPKFAFPEVARFEDAQLSRVAFVARSEAFHSALAVRSARTRPLSERLRDGTSVRLSYRGDRWWSVLGEPPVGALSNDDGFPRRLLVVDGVEGEIAQLKYNDCTPFSKPSAALWFAGIEEVQLDDARERVLAVRLANRRPSDNSDPAIGSQRVMHPRYLDFTTAKVLERLRSVDEAPDGVALRLLRDPARFAESLPLGALEEHARAATDASTLTPSQRAAFEHILRRKLTLVWGPPGTGKTHFLGQSLLAFAAAARAIGAPLRIGVTAFTHTAVDNVLWKLASLAHAFDPSALDIVKLGALAIRSSSAARDVREAPADGALPGSSAVTVVGATAFGLDKYLRAENPPFDLLIVDEASQVRLAELLVSLRALSNDGRLVLAGDHLQLPPLLNGRYPEPADGLPGVFASAFEYFTRREPAEAPYTKQLLECWRMNEELTRFSSTTLYGSGFVPATSQISRQRLDFDPSSAARDEFASWVLDPSASLVLCSLDGLRTTAENRVEASLVARLVRALRAGLRDKGAAFADDREGDQKFWSDGVFVVSPHHVQIRAIRRAISALRPWKSEPFVDTVDKMQGQECAAVLVSYGVSDPETATGEAEFIYSLQRLNVAVTRARSKSVLFVPAPLFEPPFDVLQNERAARGLGHFHALRNECAKGEARVFDASEIGARDGVLLRCWRSAQ
jgi:hypothetical protein